ncbi:MAG: hypothetical protein PHR71_03630 [Polaromonas sp.]|nr:hypothetical protein [Polaromonas sp.]
MSVPVLAGKGQILWIGWIRKRINSLCLEATGTPGAINLNLAFNKSFIENTSYWPQASLYGRVQQADRTFGRLTDSSLTTKGGEKICRNNKLRGWLRWY